MSAWKFFNLFFILAISSLAFAAEQGGFDIAALKAPVGARALGMGGAFTAVADNADAPYWNPAGLYGIQSSEVTTMQTRMSSDADHYYISYVNKLWKGALGISWIQVSLGNIARTTTVDAFNEVITTSIFSYFSNAYLLSYGLPLTRNLSFGLTAKYLTADMYSMPGGQSFGYSVTPALMLRHLDTVSLGLKVDELINEQKWGTQTTERVPPKARLGIAINRLPISNSKVTLDVAQTLKSSYSPEFALGYEWMKDSLSLRAGLLESNITAGVGFRSGVTELDYAYVQQSSLSRDNVHRLSLSGKF